MLIQNRLRTAFLTLFTLLSGCAAPISAAPPEPSSLLGIAPRYLPSFQAVRAALDGRDDSTAAAILRRLQAQLEQESRQGAGVVADEARSALPLAAGFERVVKGRRRVAALKLELVLQPEEEGAPGQELVLLVTNSWADPLRLVPGPANLVLTRTRVGADGRQARMARTQALDLFELEVAPGDSGEVSLGHYRAQLTRDMVAERLDFQLEMRAGQVQQGGESYPAQHLGVDALEYVALATYLPNGSVEPAELVRYLQQPKRSREAAMERALRILPHRRGEALALLEPLLGRATDEEFSGLAPILTWLAPLGPELSGREVWLSWIQAQ
ncbi:MAG: hypothetical protein ACI9HE_000142 [Planctomycetota bacterium]|jgi:hypothetical protein